MGSGPYYISLAQRAIRIWQIAVFGEKDAMVVPERALRHVEEAVELAQACGVTPEQIRRLVDYIFARPKGEARQEVAGSLVTLLAAANALDVNAELAFEEELRRIRQPEIIERIRNRQAEKRRVTG